MNRIKHIISSDTESLWDALTLLGGVFAVVFTVNML